MSSRAGPRAARSANRLRRVLVSALLLTGTASLLEIFPAAPSGPAGFVTAAAADTPPHIMLIVEENQEYGSIIGSSSAPYLNGLADTYASATKWYSVQHNSPTDYLDLFAGSDLGLPNGKPYFVPTLVDELHAGSIPWRGYMESMPSNCFTGTTADGLYDPNHNPFHYFTNYSSQSGGWCSSADLSSEGVLPYPGSGGLVSALNGANAPDFVMVAPNDCDDMHGQVSPCAGSSNSQLIKAGDNWMSSNLAPVLSSTWFAQNGIVIITWDEGTTAAGCCGLSAPGGHIATLVVAAGNQGQGQFTGTGDLFGILRSIEEAYGVGFLGASANAIHGDLGAAFGQQPTTGSIDGTVTDSGTDAVIAGANVSYSGGNATTDSDGKYSLTTVTPGAYTATAAATGHVSVNHNVTVTAGVGSTQDFALALDLVPPPPPPPSPPGPPRPQNVSQPAVAVAPNGTQLVFWKGAGNHLAEVWYTGSWNGPLTLPQFGTLASAPSVAVTRDGSTELVFWEGPGGHLLEAWYAGGGWHGPVDWTTAFGGVGLLASAPSVVTTADGQQLVFWQGTNGHLWEAWYAAGSWHGPVDWAALGTLASAPSATITPDGSQQLVFFQGSDGRLTEDWFTGVWNGPMEFGALSSPPSVTVTPDGSTQLVFSKTAAGHLQESWYALGSWHGPIDWTTSAFAGNGLLTSSPSATVTVDGSTQIVFWQGAGSTLWEGWYTNGAWHGPVNWSAG